MIDHTYCVNNPVKLIDPTGLAYSMYDVNTGERARYSEFGIKGYRFYDSEGNKIFDSSEVQRRINQGDYVGAVTLVLEFLGYEVVNEGIWVDDHGNEIDYLQVKMDGKYESIPTYAHIRIYDSGDMKETANRGNHPLGYAQGNDNISVRAFVKIYFFDECNMTAEELFHTVGHEMEHAKHYCTGDFDNWVDVFGNTAAAECYSEILAYQWNLAHLHIVNFPGAQERYEDLLNRYTRLSFKAKK